MTKLKVESVPTSDLDVPGYRVELGTRLSSVVDSFRTKKEAADAGGITVEQLNAYLRGDAKVPVDVLFRLGSKREVSFHWLVTGKGSRKVEGAWEPEKFTAEDFVFVPRYSVRASAGHGYVVDSEQIVDHLAFKRSWVIDRLKVDPKELALIQAHGDSMEPTISDLDLMLIHLKPASLKSDRIYAIEREGELVVKRLQRRFDGSVVLRSDNPRYEAEELAPSQVDALRIIGPVVWAGGLI